MPPLSPRPISHVELELTPSVAPYSAISPARSFVAALLSSGVKKPFDQQSRRMRKDLMLNTWSVHRRAKSSDVLGFTQRFNLTLFMYDYAFIAFFNVEMRHYVFAQRIQKYR